jgi:hypothetical protein
MIKSHLTNNWPSNTSPSASITGVDQGFGGHAAAGVFLEDRIGDLIGDLVGVAFLYGFGVEKKIVCHV